MQPKNWPEYALLKRIKRQVQQQFILSRMDDVTPLSAR